MQKEPTLTQKLVAEFIGTALLTLIGAGSVNRSESINLTLAALVAQVLVDRGRAAWPADVPQALRADPVDRAVGVAEIWSK